MMKVKNLLKFDLIFTKTKLVFFILTLIITCLFLGLVQAQESGFVNVSSLKEGKQKKYTIPESDFTEILIKARKDLEGAYLKISFSDEKPENIKAPRGVVYRYYDFDSNIKDNEITGLLEFKVPIDWFEDNELDKESVSLSRLENGRWKGLDTEYESSDGEYHYFFTSVHGFGYFVIGYLPKKAPSKGLPWVWILITLGVGIGLIVLLWLYKSYREYEEEYREERYREYYERPYRRENYREGRRYYW